LGGGGGHPDETIIRISEAKDIPKRKQKLRKYLNLKCNDINSADENK
jgi:hypothetical protein